MTSTRQASIRPIEPLHGWEHLYDCRNPTLRWILYGFDENYEKTLLALRKHWNNSIRDFYRDKLSLNTRKTPLRVAWRLDDNGDFIRTIEEEYPELDFAELVALRRYLKEAKRVDGYFSDGTVAKDALDSSRHYAKSRLEFHDLKKIVNELFKFYQRKPDSDIFGKYNLNTHAIEVYIVPCIVFSMLIEEDFLDMAIGTMAHELAHGFHHVGADKDGRIWDEFRAVEPELVEGLAEFYTREYARSIESSRPQVLRAFKKTAKYLPECYRRYEQWGDDHGLETVYQAFIEARRNGVKAFGDFEQSLNGAGHRLRDEQGHERHY